MAQQDSAGIIGESPSHDILQKRQADSSSAARRRTPKSGFFSSRLYSVRNDIVQWSSMLISLVITLLQWVSLIERFDVATIVRIAFYSGYPYFVFLFGRKGIFAQMILYANTIQAFIPYTNYTAFFITLISARMYKRLEIPAIILYIATSNITLAVQGDSALHISIHLFSCIFLYMIYFVFNESLKRRKLNLTADEEKILGCLADGKKQEFIDGYSKSTVARILKKCRKRNRFKNTKELLAEYKKQSAD